MIKGTRLWHGGAGSQLLAPQRAFEPGNFFFRQEGCCATVPHCGRMPGSQERLLLASGCGGKRDEAKSVVGWYLLTKLS